MALNSNESENRIAVVNSWGKDGSLERDEDDLEVPGKAGLKSGRNGDESSDKDKNAKDNSIRDSKDSSQEIAISFQNVSSQKHSLRHPSSRDSERTSPTIAKNAIDTGSLNQMDHSKSDRPSHPRDGVETAIYNYDTMNRGEDTRPSISLEREHQQTSSAGVTPRKDLAKSQLSPFAPTLGGTAVRDYDGFSGSFSKSAITPRTAFFDQKSHRAASVAITASGRGENESSPSSSQSSPGLYSSSTASSEDGTGISAERMNVAPEVSHELMRLANLKLHGRVRESDRQLRSVKTEYEASMRAFGLAGRSGRRPRWSTNSRGRQIQPLYRDIPNITKESTVGIRLGRAHINFMLGEYDEMADRVKGALKIAATLGFAPLISRCHFILGVALYSSHRFELALDEFRRSWDSVDKYGISSTSIESWQAKTLAALQEENPRSPDLYYQSPLRISYRTDEFFAQRIAARTPAEPLFQESPSTRTARPSPTMRRTPRRVPLSPGLHDKLVTKDSTRNAAVDKDPDPRTADKGFQSRRTIEALDETFLNQEILRRIRIPGNTTPDNSHAGIEAKGTEPNPGIAEKESTIQGNPNQRGPGRRRTIEYPGPGPLIEAMKSRTANRNHPGDKTFRSPDPTSTLRDRSKPSISPTLPIAKVSPPISTKTVEPTLKSLLSQLEERPLSPTKQERLEKELREVLQRARDAHQNIPQRVVGFSFPEETDLGTQQDWNNHVVDQIQGQALAEHGSAPKISAPPALLKRAQSYLLTTRGVDLAPVITTGAQSSSIPVEEQKPASSDPQDDSKGVNGTGGNIDYFSDDGSSNGEVDEEDVLSNFGSARTPVSGFV